MNLYEKIAFIRDRISDAELCVMVAEEASEVAQAALKLHRVLDGTNPTPTNKASAVSKLGQEVDDLMIALTALRYTDEPKDTMSLYQHNKLDRWIKRLEEVKRDSETD